MTIPLDNATLLAQKLDEGSLTSRQVTEGYLERIARGNDEYNIFCNVLSDTARLAADQSDRRRQQGKPLSRLDGVPIAIKDILCTQGHLTTCGSKSLANFRPPYNATVVEKLEAAGVVLLGKTNMDEFAMGGSTETSIFGSTRNPWDATRTAGGSSGGSAAALASRMTPLAIGSDTGGSIRQPASYCGICGLKPTYGRISRFGLIAFASSLDQLGPMAHSVEDIAELLTVMAGHDPKDSTSVDAPVPEYGKLLACDPRDLRVGVVREHLDHEGLDEDVRQSMQSALDVFKQGGAKIVDISLPHSHYGVPTYYIIAPSEASSNLSRYDGAHYGHRASISSKEYSESESPLIEMYCRSRSEGFGKEVKRRIMLGTYALSSGYYDAYYLKALKVRRMIREDFDRAFEKVDVVVGPTTPSPAFGLGEKLSDPVQMYLVDLFTVGANLAGIPSLSIPSGKTRTGLPIGMQLQAAPLQETRLLQAGHWYQQTTGFRPQHP